MRALRIAKVVSLALHRIKPRPKAQANCIFSLTNYIEVMRGHHAHIHVHMHSVINYTHVCVYVGAQLCTHIVRSVYYL